MKLATILAAFAAIFALCRFGKQELQDRRAIHAPPATVWQADQICFMSPTEAYAVRDSRKYSLPSTQIIYQGQNEILFVREDGSAIRAVRNFGILRQAVGAFNMVPEGPRDHLTLSLLSSN